MSVRIPEKEEWALSLSRGFSPAVKPPQYVMCNQHHLNKAKYRLGYQIVVADFAHGLGKTGFSVATQNSW